MGDKSKSGFQLPGLDSLSKHKSTTGLPKLGSFQHKTQLPKLSSATSIQKGVQNPDTIITQPASSPEPPVVPETTDDAPKSIEALADVFFDEDDMKTEIGNADDIMSVLSGIDAWDNLSSDDNDKTEAQNPILDIDDLPNLEVMSEISEPLSPENDEKIGTLNEEMPVAAIDNSTSFAPSTPRIPALSATSEKFSIAAPPVSSKSAHKPNVSTISPPPASSICMALGPSSIPPVGQSPKAPESVPEQSEIDRSQMLEQSPNEDIQTKTAEQTLNEEMVQLQAAKQTPAQGQNSKQSVQLSDEEQYLALLNAMSPEERAQYEIHCQKEQMRAEKAQREFTEMYGQSNVDNPNSVSKGFVFFLAAIILVLGGGIIYLVTSPSSDETPAPETKKSKEEEIAIPVKKAPVLQSYPVQINIENANSIFVNGQIVKDGTAKFIKGRPNTVIAYAPHRLPYFKTFDSEVSKPIEAELEPDTLYPKGTISFKIKNSKDIADIVSATFDGEKLYNLSTGTQIDVVLGRPHIFTLETTVFQKHMHLIWPNHKNTTVTLPKLKPKAAPASSTECILNLYSTVSEYGIIISTGIETTERAVIIDTLYGDMIEYHVSKYKHQTLDFSVIPDGYGTLSCDVALLKKSRARP